MGEEPAAGDPIVGAPLGLVTVGDGGGGGPRIEHANAAALDLVGRSADDVVGARPEDVLGARAWGDVTDGLREPGGPGLVETEVPGPFGRRAVGVHWSVIDHHPGRTLVLAIDDLEPRRAVVRALQQRAFRDALTGLPNRALFLEHLDRARESTRRHGRELAVAVVDVDDLKAVNETLGHAAGDALLASLAHRLRRALRASDVAGRIGGDEFAVVCPDLVADVDVARIGARILATVNGDTLLHGRRWPATVSVGLAVVPAADDLSSAALVNRADEALRRAKRRGKHRFVVFDDDLDAEVRRLDLLDGELRRACDRDELRLHYQPIIDLRIGRTTGAEALVRWAHPVHGEQQPGSFLPVAESSGAIVAVGEWVLRTACAQVRAWNRARPAPLQLSINVSARQLGAGDVARALEQCLDAGTLEAGDLRIEVTETATAGAAVCDELWAVHRLGIPVGIDDFGTGHASLASLHRLPVAFLKIDGSFVRDVVDDPTRRAIVSSVAHLAAALGIDVVAEEVERRDQASLLLELGCTGAQGYLYGRPAPPAQFEAALAAGGTG